MLWNRYMCAISLVGLIGFFIYFFYDHSLKEDIQIRGKRTIGVVYHDTFGGVYAEYIVAGIKHKTLSHTSPYQGLINGECYEVAYDPEHISKSVIIFSKPVIDDGQFLSTYTTKVKKTFLSKNFVFHYSILGVEYERGQKSGASDKIVNGKNYLVKYKKDNFKIAYLIW
jgi:hypothetical protein